MKAEYWSAWDAPTRVITTRLAGEIDVDDVARWAAGLQGAVVAISPADKFKLLVDQRGYEMRDMAAHKAMRVVIPQLLAQHGMAAAVLDLFPENEVFVTRMPDVICVACATVHHDVDKMVEYERTLGRTQQRFFTDVGLARQWLLELE